MNVWHGAGFRATPCDNTGGCGNAKTLAATDRSLGESPLCRKRTPLVRRTNRAVHWSIMARLSARHLGAGRTPLISRIAHESLGQTAAAREYCPRRQRNQQKAGV